MLQKETVVYQIKEYLKPRDPNESIAHNIFYILWPGRWSSPVDRSVSLKTQDKIVNRALTAIDFFVDSVSDFALVCLSYALNSQAIAEQRLRVHSPLKSIALPSKEIIAVCTIAYAVIVAPHEGLRAVLWPKRPVVELRGVPHGLKGHLRCTNGMGRRTRTSGNESPPVCVVHVVLVVRGVKVLAIPASNT